MDSEQLTTQSLPVFRAVGEPRKGSIEKFLCLFADVRAGEGATVVLLFLNGFLLMASYYILKTIREALTPKNLSAAKGDSNSLGATGICS